MHSEFRRMPAERVRHAKRLGHVQPVNDPYASPLVFAEDVTTNSTTSTTTSQTTTAKTTSATPTPVAVTPTTKTSSSQLSTSLSTPSEALTSSASSTTATTPSTTPSTSSPAATRPTTSPTQTTSQSVVLITTTPGATTTAINNTSSASSQTLSGGALGGIIAVSIVVALALVIFIVRKTYLRRRQKHRLSWPAADIIFNQTKPLPAAPFDDFSEKPASLRNPPTSPFEAHRQSSYSSPPQPPIQRVQSPFAGYAGPTLPPASYNNPMPMYSQPSLRPGNSAVLMAHAAAGANPYSPPAPATMSVPMFPTASEAVVNRGFIPTLPDELSVTAGDRIRVLAQYDDAWALCVNGRGEQGMVPQECLNRPVAANQADWRNAGRTSSLVSDGRHY